VLCTVIKSYTRSKTLELVEYVLCTLYYNTCTGSKIQELVEYVPCITVHSTYSTNSKVLDRVHDSDAVECVLCTVIHVP
jgi:hypothetical protein